MSIIYDFKTISQRMNNLDTKYDNDANEWIKTANEFYIDIAGSLNPYVIGSDWNPEEKESALIVNARIKAAKKFLSRNDK